MSPAGGAFLFPSRLAVNLPQIDISQNGKYHAFLFSDINYDADRRPARAGGIQSEAC